MGLLNILNKIAQNKFGSNTAVVLPKTTTPLGLHQGSVVTMPDIDIALAQADGSICAAPSGQQVVVAVGSYSLFNLDIHNVYLADGVSFIQVVSKAGTVKEARLWCSYAEVLPQSSEDWEMWLGSYQRDAAGEFIRDSSGVALVAESGLIGYPQFQIDGPPAIVYDRYWSPTADSVDPVKYRETILDNTGTYRYVSHECMEYYRKLGTAADAVTEYLLATVANDTTEGASVNIFVGIPLDYTNLQVIPA